jgi:hypothetical protein
MQQALYKVITEQIETCDSQTRRRQFYRCTILPGPTDAAITNWVMSMMVRWPLKTPSNGAG